jgi:hypothetical protein
MLVNDLDLRVDASAATYYPYKLDRNNPSNAATASSKNPSDNVEVVYIANPTEYEYTITVDYEGSLEYGFQAFSMIISGIQDCDHELVLWDETVAVGEERVEEASYSVYVAGNGHYFTVEGNGTNGGDITVTAGSWIRLLPGFHSKKGGKFHGYIGPCGSAE